MQDVPLLVSSMIAHAAAINARHEIVAREASGAMLRSNYAETERRCRRLAKGLARLGIAEGDRVASLAWNGRLHLELFHGVPGMGAVLHTLNPRFGEEQLVYIVNHAGDRLLAFDPDLLPLVERIAPRLEAVEHYVLLGGADDLPSECELPLLAYEDLLGDDDFAWPVLDERAAALLCYTSGTTGQPKGVLASNRSTVIHALAAQSACAFGLTPQDAVLLVVPMFHAYGWGLPYVAAISGAKLVLPGPAPEPATLVELIRSEAITLSMGVPTVWNGILAHLDREGGDLAPLRRALIGGSAAPPEMARRLREEFELEVVTGWGMTELNPLGSFTGSSPDMEALPAAERERLRIERAGRLLFPLQVSIRDVRGAPVPADGASPGDIWVRGPCVAERYYGGEAMLDAAGWFSTGDVGTLDPHGSIAIVDRTKDLIKSGGEWISSADLERAALSTQNVAQAAAIAASHPKWQERPLLLLVAEAGATIDLAAVESALAASLPRWQLPDAILVVDSLPLTATGKIDKKKLRALHGGYLLAHPAEAESGASA
jgi:fatty-acyl-CoA synthase